MSLKKVALSSFLWSFLELFFSRGLSFIISIILARILLPEDFGVLGSIYLFIGIGTILVDSGLTQSLIRTKNVNNKDLSTVFFFNLFVSILLYTLVFFSAPLVANFYSKEILTSVIRVYAFIFISNALYSIQNTLLIKELKFKTISSVSIPANLFSGVVSVTLAYLGYGVWSLVYGALALSFANLFFYFVKSPWRPKKIFNVSVLKKHISFGFMITLSGIINIIYNNLYYVILGKYFSLQQVGYFQRAENLKNFPVMNLSNLMNKVTYPLFSKIQNDIDKLANLYRRMMLLMLFIITCVMVILIALSDDLFIFLFTEKWIDASIYFKVIASASILVPVQSYLLNILKVFNRSDMIFKVVYQSKVIGIFLLIPSVFLGIDYILISYVISAIITFIMYSLVSGKFINYSLSKQIKDFFPIILNGIIVYTTIYYMKSITSLSIGLNLFLFSIIGIVEYIIIAKLFRIESMYELLKILKK